MGPGLADVFRDKPEIVTDLPEWMLSKADMDRLRDGDGLAVVELAGRDSVAAALAAVQSRPLAKLLPTYVFTGTEYGPWSWVGEALSRLKQRLPQGVELAPPLVLGSPGFWGAMNGRFLTGLTERYRFSPICVGCHLYLHSVRLPLAKSLGAAIISGERENHDGKVKVNQLGACLDAYAGLAHEFGVELLSPIRRVSQGSEIRGLLGMDWPEGGEQLQCAVSGNYRGLGGEAVWDDERLAAYLREFALPLARRVVEAYLKGENPDHFRLAAEVFGQAG